VKTTDEDGKTNKMAFMAESTIHKKHFKKPANFNQVKLFFRLKFSLAAAKFQLFFYKF